MNDEAQAVADNERGATLIELLMGIVLTGLILTGMTGGIITYFKSAQAVQYLLTETPDLQLAATRFATDVQSSSVVNPTTGTPCGGVPPASDAIVAEFQWNDTSTTTAGSGPLIRVTYTYRASAHELRRNACKAGVVQQQTVLVDHVDPSAAGQPNLQPINSKQFDLGLQVCTVRDTDSSPHCLDSAIPATFTGVRRST